MANISLTTLTAVSCVFTGLAVLLTIGRLWIRYRIIRSPYWDDIAHVLALLLLIAQVSIISSAGPLIYQLLKLETGKTQKQPNTGLYVRLDVAAILFAWSCLFAVKIAFLLFYRHIFQVSRRFIQSWWIVFIIVALTYCILITGSLTECGSPSDLGDIAKCDSPSMVRRQEIFTIYSCAINVLSDLAIMVLPLAMLKGLQMRTATKLGLAGIFCCAFITIMFDILRTVETATKGGQAFSTPLFSNLESAVAVIVSCLPSFAALSKSRKASNGRRIASPYSERSIVISDDAKRCINTGSSFGKASPDRSCDPDAAESEVGMMSVSSSMDVRKASGSRIEEKCTA